MAERVAKNSFRETKNHLGEVFRVYGSIGALLRSNLVVIWVALFFLFWILNPIKALPTPFEVWAAMQKAWGEPAPQGLVYNVYVTLKLNVVGLLYASLISICTAYLSVIPFFNPFNKIVQWLRYIPIVGFNLVFLSLFTIGWPMKVAMLTTGMSFFLVTSMTAVITAIPRLKY